MNYPNLHYADIFNLGVVEDIRLFATIRQQPIMDRFDGLATSGDVIKVAHFSGFVPYKGCLDLISSHLPNIQYFTCTHSR